MSSLLAQLRHRLASISPIKKPRDSKVPQAGIIRVTLLRSRKRQVSDLIDDEQFLNPYIACSVTPVAACCVDLLGDACSGLLRRPVDATRWSLLRRPVGDVRCVPLHRPVGDVCWSLLRRPVDVEPVAALLVTTVSACWVDLLMTAVAALVPPVAIDLLLPVTYCACRYLFPRFASYNARSHEQDSSATAGACPRR